VWNVVGAVIWTDGILLAGHLLARQITDHIPPGKIDNYLLPVVIFIVLIAAIPLIVDIVRRHRQRKRERAREDGAASVSRKVGAHRR
jgi:membrane-associated protein